MNVSVSIMAHPKREAFVPGLLDKLDVEHVAVVIDEVNNLWDTRRRALLAYAPEASHHLVLQDDAIPCRDLVAGVGAMVRYVGSRPIALYTGRQTPNQPAVLKHLDVARYTNAPFFSYVGPLWGVAVVIPTQVIPELVKDCDRMSSLRADDQRMTQWFRRHAIQCAYSVPSVVDHRDTPSLIPGRVGKGRCAHIFIGQDSSALDVDWGREPDPVPEFIQVVRNGRQTYLCCECGTTRPRQDTMKGHVRRHHARQVSHSGLGR